MTTQVLFLQGGGEGAHDEWDQKLVDSLARSLPDHRIRYPRMPDEADPHFAPWKAAIVRELDALDDGAILVGHSLGGMMLLHTLAEHAPRFTPGMLVLIAAPFIGDGGWPSDEIEARTDFGNAIGAMRVHFFQGSADDTVSVDHAKLYARAIPHATVHILDGRDHQLNDDLREVAQVIHKSSR